MDETVHVAAHTQACRAMNLVPSKELESLSRQTAIWLTEGLNVPKYEEKGQPDFWIKQSWQLLKEGRAAGLANTRRSRVPAFFEIDMRAQPIYGR